MKVFGLLVAYLGLTVWFYGLSIAFLEDFDPIAHLLTSFEDALFCYTLIFLVVALWVFILWSIR